MFSEVFFQTRASSLSYLAIITNKIQGALHGNRKSQAYQYYFKKKNTTNNKNLGACLRSNKQEYGNIVYKVTGNCGHLSGAADF